MFKYCILLVFSLHLLSNPLLASKDNNYEIVNHINSLIKEKHYLNAIKYLNQYPKFFFLKGKCYLNLLKYKKALFYFLKAQAEEKEVTSKKLFFYIGLCYYKLQDFQNAIKYLQLSRPTDQVNFFIGLSHFYIGNYYLALRYFDKVKDNFKNEADYFKALCAIKLDRRKKAITILKQILKNNPESYLKNQIYDKLDQYDNGKVSIMAYSALSYDSNVLREPESSTSQSSNESDFYNEIFFNINDKFLITEEFAFKPELSYYKSTYQDLSKYNLDGYNIGAGIEFLNENLFFSLKPYYEYFEINNENYQKNFKILTEILFNNFKKNYLNVKLLLGKKNFLKYDFKDCNFFDIRLDQYLKFRENYYRLGVSFGKENAESDLYSFKSFGISEGFLIQIMENLILKNDIFIEFRDYDNKWERTFKVILDFACIKYKFFKFGALIKYIKNSSNKNDFDYSTTQSSLYISFSY